MSESNPSQKQRHGCLTAYLILMLLANSGLMVVYSMAALSGQGPANIPEWAFPVLAVAGLLNVIFSIALFRWKKWGFWGYVVLSLLVLGINLKIGLGIGPSVTGLTGIAILFGVLQIGNDKSGWKQLD